MNLLNHEEKIIFFYTSNYTVHRIYDFETTGMKHIHLGGDYYISCSYLIVLCHV